MKEEVTFDDRMLNAPRLWRDRKKMTKRTNQEADDAYSYLSRWARPTINDCSQEMKNKMLYGYGTVSTNGEDENEKETARQNNRGVIEVYGRCLGPIQIYFCGLPTNKEYDDDTFLYNAVRSKND